MSIDWSAFKHLGDSCERCAGILDEKIPEIAEEVRRAIRTARAYKILADRRLMKQ